MKTTPTIQTRRLGLRPSLLARALLAVSALAALAIPTRSFAQAPTFNTLVTTYTNVGSAFPDNATVGDINGDGKLDAIVTGGDNPSIMHVMLGNGDGTFTDHGVQLPQITASNVANLHPSLAGYLPVSVGGFGQVKAIDVNHDGKLDLVCIESVGINFTNYSFIGVLINTGNDANGVPQFTAMHYWSAFLGARTLTLGDLNGDGAPDLTLGYGGNGIYVWLNNGSGGYTPGQLYSLTPGAGGPAVGQAVIADLNGDGKADYVVTSNQNHGANIFFGNGDGTLQAPIFLPNFAISVAVADVNGDGKPDLLMGGNLSGAVGSDGLIVYLNNGGGSFAAPTLYNISGLNGGLAGGGSVVVADINGDGILDAVLSNLGNNTVAVLLGDGHGGFGTPITFSAQFAPTWVFVGDFNGDGKTDIGIDLRNARNFGVLLNTTPSGPPPITPITTATAPVLSVPANITVNATSAAGATVTFNATATSSISSEIFRRSTTTAEAWKAYSVTFIPTISGNFKLGFNLTAGGPSGDNSILIDAVKLTSGTTTVFADGFETPAFASNTGASANGATGVVLGNWVCNNYSGILNGSPPNWGLAAQGLGSADGTSQYAYLQAVFGTLGNIKSVQTFALVAGQTYTLSFYQASRRDFGGTDTYTVTLESTESDPVTATPASGSTFPVGTTNVNLSATNSAGGTSTGAFSVTVNKAPATVTIAGLNQTYDGSAKTVTATTSPVGLNVVINYLGNNTNAGSCPVQAIINDPIYTGSATGTLVIAKASSTTTTAGAGPFTYDGATHAGGSGTVTGAGVVTGAATVTYAGDQVNAGSYTVTAHYAGDANHTASDGAAVTITINKAAATVVPAPYTVTYDGSAHTAGFTITGVAGETGATVGTVTQNTTHTDVGVYADTWSFTGTRNYSSIAATPITDTIKGTATASLVPVRGGGDDESSQFFTVVFSATDPAGIKTLTGTLNGVTVTNGQVVQLQTIKSGAQTVKRDDGKLQIKATSFTLTVVATYTNGGTATATVVPVFVKNGKDSEDKSDKSASDSKGGKS